MAASRRLGSKRDMTVLRDTDISATCFSLKEGLFPAPVRPDFQESILTEEEL